MHPRLTVLISNIERQRTSLLATASQLSDDQLRARPGPGDWTPVQILDHIAVVEDNVVRLLAKRLMRAKESGLGRDMVNEPFQSVHTEEYRTRKIEAPENVRPAMDVSPLDAFAHLEFSHAAFQDLMRDADGFDLTQVFARHQIFGELNMYEWLVFLSEHEGRHITQLQRTAAVISAI